MEAGEGPSSSNELSSAPNSDNDSPNFPRAQRPPATTQEQVHSPTSDSTIQVRPQNSVGHSDPASTLSATATSASNVDARQDPAPAKVRKPRKKKDAPATEAEKKEKPPRKPRATSGTAAASRKKPKLENANGLPDDAKPPRLVVPAAPDVAKPRPLGLSFLNSAILPPTSEAAKTTQIGISRPTQEYEPSRPPSADARPPTSPQPASTRPTVIYDPVRSVTIERPPEPSRPPSTPQPPYTLPRPVVNASTPSAISSIIESPPSASRTLSHPPPPPPPPPSLSQGDERPGPSLKPAAEKMGPIAMEVDSPITVPAAPPKPNIAPSEGASNAPSPKPARAKEQPPPPAQGTGLLSSSLFGGDSKLDGLSQGGDKGPNIVLHVDLKGKNNQVVNFARMAEEKYGFAALYPRQAAQRDRLARVAAAGAALERSANSSKRGGSGAESGDEDLSVDIDRDSDNDGDVAMGGLNGGQDTGGNSGTDGAAPKRRRRRKMEEYDQDDPFVDDSEMLWEAHAAASKDGFFVYCGPLVPEGEKPAVERADGTVKRGRGRGRGGGMGSRGGRGSASAAVHSEGSGGAGAGGGSGSRGGGPGSRGGTTTRKPRVTKAERQMRELEKQNREKMAPLAAKPSTFPT